MSRQHRVHNPFDAIAFTRSRMLPGHNQMFRTLSHWPVKKMRNLIAATFLAMPLGALAGDRWIQIGAASPPLGPLLVNVEYVVPNGNGNRVATIRVNFGDGYQTDTVTEFDCKTRKQHTLSSATTDKAGHLMVANGTSEYWFSGTDAIGLQAVCNAPLANP